MLGLLTRLQEARQERGLTQQQVADRLGVPRPNIARWERGRQLPRVDTALKLAAILDTKVEMLWTLVPDQDAPATAGTGPGA